MKVIAKAFQNKNGKEWNTNWTTEDTASATASLAEDLSAKYILGATWVKRIVRKQYYTHQEYTVYYDNGHRSVYTVQNG